MRTTAHLLLFTFALSSCVTIYQPSTVVTPLPEKKGDMEVQATFRKAAVVSRGATLNASYAYAFSEKYAAMVNLEYTNETYNPTTRSLSILIPLKIAQEKSTLDAITPPTAGTPRFTWA